MNNTIILQHHRLIFQFITSLSPLTLLFLIFTEHNMLELVLQNILEQMDILGQIKVKI